MTTDAAGLALQADTWTNKCVEGDVMYINKMEGMCGSNSDGKVDD